LLELTLAGSIGRAENISIFACAVDKTQLIDIAVLLTTTVLMKTRAFQT